MSTTTVELTMEQMNNIAKMVGEKDEKDLVPADRVFYSTPLCRGAVGTNSEGNKIYNCTYDSLVSQSLFDAIEVNSPRYERFLYDFFYRRFMGYEQHYFRKPTSAVNIKIYNRVAEDSGHSEWKILNDTSDSESTKNVTSIAVIDRSNRPVVISDSATPRVVDVLDEGGNVIASDICVPAEKKDDKSPVNQSKESKPNDKKKDKKPKTQPESSSSPVKFSEKNDPKPFEDKDRADGYTTYNRKTLTKYPEITKVVDALKAKGLYCKVDNYHGLVKLFTFKPGVAEGQCIVIDPAKIKKYYSIIMPSTGDDQNPLYPFYNIFVPFGTEYYNKYVSGIMPNIAELAVLAEESRKDDTFYHHISYSSIPAKDFDDVKKVLDPVVAAITASGLNIRFKLIEGEYASKYSFTLITGVKEGLSFFAKDNANYDGLRLEVKVASETVVLLTVSGMNAQDFRDRIFQASNGQINMKVRKSSPKKENKKPEKKSAKQTQKTEALKAEEKKSETDLISQLTDFVSNIKKSDPESFTE